MSGANSVAAEWISYLDSQAVELSVEVAAERIALVGGRSDVAAAVRVEVARTDTADLLDMLGRGRFLDLPAVQDGEPRRLRLERQATGVEVAVLRLRHDDLVARWLVAARYVPALLAALRNALTELDTREALAGLEVS
ncbi:hypothetical protein [Actinoalloteichus hymeniacidonis]|uniref:Uncharacterized protein n=1 Tax=Actinoalloteichus hymeniacidonis TaxID=340345 RepID=A0AAC9MX30_9PSEU|nr:hypothetical protein [Actinoalloteichus hymeniacidonis]AOS61621.1 hypothetical protein TL08_03955 [Actinoalloteichus hymeniacidonis]MBB5910368.1 hypothetical protein [Actinoalloteichus hymeniacidonis]